MKGSARARAATSFTGRLRSRNKYGAKKETVDNIVFDSRLEARHYKVLRSMYRAGAIAGLFVHPEFPIYIRGVRVCVIELDFYYMETKTKVYHYVDCKGADDKLSKLKRKMVEAEYGIKVELVRK